MESEIINMNSAGQLKLVNCTQKHYALLAELGASTFYEAFSAYNSESDMQRYVNETYSLDQVKKNLQKEEVHYDVAYLDYEDAGYIKTIRDVVIAGLDGRTIEIEKIYVRKKFWGRKVGYALLRKTIEQARANGFKYLYLGVWQENKQAISFYERNGFKTFSTRQFQLGEKLCDDFLMALNLEAN